jgi:hypothetical protein
MRVKKRVGGESRSGPDRRLEPKARYAETRGERRTMSAAESLAFIGFLLACVAQGFEPVQFANANQMCQFPIRVPF